MSPLHHVSHVTIVVLISSFLLLNNVIQAQNTPVTKRAISTKNSYSTTQLKRLKAKKNYPSEASLGLKKSSKASSRAQENMVSQTDKTLSALSMRIAHLKALPNKGAAEKAAIAQLEQQFIHAIDEKINTLDKMFN